MFHGVPEGRGDGPDEGPLRAGSEAFALTVPILCGSSHLGREYVTATEDRGAPGVGMRRPPGRRIITVDNCCAWCGLLIIGETRKERGVLYHPTCFLRRIAVLQRTR